MLARYLYCWLVSPQTNKQTNKQTNTPTNKQTKQTNKQTNNLTSKQNRSSKTMQFQWSEFAWQRVTRVEFYLERIKWKTICIVRIKIQLRTLFLLSRKSDRSSHHGQVYETNVYSKTNNLRCFSWKSNHFSKFDPCRAKNRKKWDLWPFWL